RGGGSPNCAIDFSPVANPTFFCPDESVAFGNVNIGQMKTIDLQVINTGSEDCTVGAINFGSLTSSAFTYSSPTLPGIIPVNESRIISVNFEPTPPSGNNPFEEIPFLCGTNTLNLTVNSGPDGMLAQESVALSGRGTRPDIDVIPGELDFGLVTVGCCSEWKDVRIYNSGDGDLTINDVSIVAGSSPGFETTQPTGNVVVPNSSTEFRARFCATEVGEASGIIEIASTDDNEEYFTVPMRGEGTLDNLGLDEFQQPLRPMVDVLWAIDDSGSMSEEQQNLANNFENFIDTATSLDTDYHMGVVNTDSESEWAGKLYACSGNPLWIDDSQSVAEQRSQFQCNVKVSDSGRPGSDSKESPLQAARMALDYPNIDDHNAGFYREEAKLYVILVTDEEDQSDGTPQLYVDYFRNLKGVGNPDLLNISAIAGPPPGGCDTAEGNQVDYDAVDAVGGQFRSICSADWADLISSLGLDVFNARRQFPLSRPATQDSITVTICEDDGNGNPVNCQPVAYDASNGWSFDPVTNSIVLNGSAIPGPGEHIRVDYEAACFE
ncbi:MAG: choice-of-anchor D domain-containing protein, partial [Myxococcota bacterium]|nr:choice-of-anchor D domain-containing protein [Myxococcota bacterium]